MARGSFRAVFVRHGQKQDVAGTLEYELPLDRSQGPQLNALANELAKRNVQPNLWLASHFAHCWQTAQQLAGSSGRVVRLSALTPFSSDDEKCLRSILRQDTNGHCLAVILRELTAFRVDISKINPLGFVGHEERLSNFINTLLPPVARILPLKRLEALIIVAESLSDLGEGRGHVEARLSREGVVNL